MLRRVLHWLGWTIVFGLVPFVAVLVVAGLRGQLANTRDIFGSGEGLLVGVTWLAAGVSELRDAPESRAGWAAAALWGSVVFMFVDALAYGSIASDSAHTVSPHLVALISMIDLGLAGLISIGSVVAGTPEAT